MYIYLNRALAILPNIYITDGKENLPVLVIMTVCALIAFIK